MVTTQNGIKGTLLLFVICISFYNNAEAQNSNDAVSYMNKISMQYKIIQREMWDYTSSVAHSHSAKLAERKRSELINTIDKSKNIVQNLPPYMEDTSLRDSVISFLMLNLYVLKEDFAKIIDMEEVAEQSYDEMEMYLLAQEKANEKIDLAAERMEIQYRQFATKHGVTLIETQDEISQKLSISSGALKYYNQIYLIFFKAYKQELYLMDAFNRKDINAIEQSRNALSVIAGEGVTKLSTVGGHKGDLSLKTNCTRLLTFYKDEADNQIPIITDFMITTVEYEKMASLFESKDRMMLSEAEVQKYNGSVNAYNKGLAKFNSVNSNLNNKRAQYLNNWNNGVTNYMERHIPRK